MPIDAPSAAIGRISTLLQISPMGDKKGDQRMIIRKNALILGLLTILGTGWRAEAWPIKMNTIFSSVAVISISAALFTSRYWLVKYMYDRVKERRNRIKETEQN